MWTNPQLIWPHLPQKSLMENIILCAVDLICLSMLFRTIKIARYSEEYLNFKKFGYIQSLERRISCWLFQFIEINQWTLSIWFYFSFSHFSGQTLLPFFFYDSELTEKKRLKVLVRDFLKDLLQFSLLILSEFKWIN